MLSQECGPGKEEVEFPPARLDEIEILRKVPVDQFERALHLARAKLKQGGTNK